MPEYKSNSEPKTEKTSEADNERVRGYFIGLALAAKNKSKDKT